jgi:hypothetical protein
MLHEPLHIIISFPKRGCQTWKITNGNFNWKEEKPDLEIIVIISSSRKKASSGAMTSGL